MTRRARRVADADRRYWQLAVVIPRSASTTAAAVVRARGALGSLEQPLDDARSSLTALFDDAAADDTLVDRVRRDLAALGVPVSGNVRLMEVTGGDWAEAWPEYLFPIAIGRGLLVTPPWIENVETDRTVIVIEPGGFGTGHHPTTVGCLEALEPLVARRRAPRAAIDLGTGSGILAIAAARLGVRQVVAVDEDAGTIACATANTARNGVADRIRCVVADAAAVEAEPAPLVTANLLAPIHRRLAARYPALVKRGGHLVLGGIEDREADDVLASLSGRFTLRGRRTREGWTTLVFSRV